MRMPRTRALSTNEPKALPLFRLSLYIHPTPRFDQCRETSKIARAQITCISQPQLFELAPYRDDKKQRVWFIVILKFIKTFRETLRKECLNESDNSSSALGKDFDVAWDQDEISKSIELQEILKGVRPGQKQKKRILDFTRATIEKIENSGFIKLAEKTLKQY
jgi:hypothetical protein